MIYYSYFLSFGRFKTPPAGGCIFFVPFDSAQDDTKKDAASIVNAKQKMPANHF
jgi:hypothetical protein